MKRELTIDFLLSEANKFVVIESKAEEPTLFGVTDGKAVGTYLERKFTKHLEEKFTLKRGNSTSGIDFPGLDVDIKVTSIRQPQTHFNGGCNTAELFKWRVKLMVSRG